MSRKKELLYNDYEQDYHRNLMVSEVPPVRKNYDAVLTVEYILIDYPA